MTAKQDRLRDEGQGNNVLYMPSMVGAKLPQAIPYLFDEVFALRVDKNDEGETTRWLQTEKDWQYEAKDRSGVLDQFEVSDLTHIFLKVRDGLDKSKTINKETNNDKN